MHSRLVRIAFTLALLVIAGCGASLYLPEPRDASADASLEDLIRGREIYTQRCARCHSLFLPERFSMAQWKTSLNKMQPRARINDTEKELILKMIFAGKLRGTQRD